MDPNEVIQSLLVVTEYLTRRVRVLESALAAAKAAKEVSVDSIPDSGKPTLELAPKDQIVSGYVRKKRSLKVKKPETPPESSSDESVSYLDVLQQMVSSPEPDAEKAFAALVADKTATADQKKVTFDALVEGHTKRVCCE